MQLRRAASVAGIAVAVSVLGGCASLLGGCARAERWVSEKVDESLAHAIESVTDDIADGKYHPSGVPNRRKAAKDPATSSSVAVIPDPVAAQPGSSAAPADSSEGQ